MVTVGMSGPRIVDAAQVAGSISVGQATDALADALRTGFDPDDDVPRLRVDTAAGHLLVMPSTIGDTSAVKLLSATPGNADRGLPATTASSRSR